MSRRTAAALAAILIVSCGVVAGVPPDAAGPDAPSSGASPDKEMQARIEKLIAQLGDVDFDKREAAQKELIEIGQPARAQVTEALKSSDAEVATRAAFIMKELDGAHVTLVITDSKGKPLYEKDVSIYVQQPAALNPDRVGRNFIPLKIVTKLAKDGKIALKTLEPGPYHVSIIAEGFREIAGTMLFGKGTYDRRITLYGSGAIKGKVVDAHNGDKPLANFTVCIGGGDDEAAVVTDKNGEFAAEGLHAGRVNLGPMNWQNGEYILDPDRAVVYEGETTEVTIKAAAKKDVYGSLELVVADPDGEPFSEYLGLRIEKVETVKGRDQRTQYWMNGVNGYCKPDADGKIVVNNIEPGRYFFTLANKGYAPIILRDVVIKSGEKFTVKGTLKIEYGVPLKVKVVAPDGAPLTYAAVILGDAAAPPFIIREKLLLNNVETAGPGFCGTAEPTSIAAAPWFWNVAITDDKGIAEFDSLVEGKYFARVYQRNNGLSDETTVEVKRGGEVAVDLARTGSVALNVVDKDTGKPVSVNWRFVRDLPAEAEKDAPEQIRLQNEWPDDSAGWGGKPLVSKHLRHFILVLSASGYKARILRTDDILAAKKKDFPVEMEKLGTGGLEITFVPGKGRTPADIGGVQVVRAAPAIDAAVRTPDAKGVLTVDGLVEGPCCVIVLDKQRQFIIGQFRCDVEKDKTTKVTLNLPGAGKVEGTLTDEDGKPLGGVFLTLHPDKFVALAYAYLAYQKKITPYSASTDSAGHFSFDDVAEGDYVLFPEGYHEIYGLRRVKVKAAETTSVDYRIEKTLDVTVLLKVAEGKPSLNADYTGGSLNAVGNSGAYIYLVYHGSRPPGGQFSDNKLRLPFVRPGRYLLSVGDNVRTVERIIDVTAETKTIEIPCTFKPGKCSVSGKMAKQPMPLSAQVLGNCRIYAVGDTYRYFTDLLPDGSFRFAEMQPGKYRLYVYSLDGICANSAEYAPVKEVTVEEGKNVEGVTIP